jgi:hypothetical protein
MEAARARITTAAAYLILTSEGQATWKLEEE